MNRVLSVFPIIIIALSQSGFLLGTASSPFFQGRAPAAPAQVSGADRDEAIRLYNSNQFRSAAQKFDELLQAFPNDPEILTYSGKAHFHSSNLGLAEERLRLVAEQEAYLSEANFYLGLIASATGRSQEAASLLRRARQTERGNLSEYNSRSRLIQQRLNSIGEQRQVLNSYYEIDGLQSPLEPEPQSLSREADQSPAMQHGSSGAETDQPAAQDSSADGQANQSTLSSSNKTLSRQIGQVENDIEDKGDEAVGKALPKGVEGRGPNVNLPNVPRPPRIPDSPGDFKKAPSVPTPRMPSVSVPRLPKVSGVKIPSIPGIGTSKKPSAPSPGMPTPRSATAKKARYPFRLRTLRLDGINHPNTALREFEGRFLIMHFWDASSQAARAEMVELSKFWGENQNALQEQGINLITISNDSSEEELKAFVDQGLGEGASKAVRVYHDPRKRANDRFELPDRLPVTLFLDPNGKKIWLEEGAIDWSHPELPSIIQRILEPADAEK